MVTVQEQRSIAGGMQSLVARSFQDELESADYKKGWQEAAKAAVDVIVAFLQETGKNFNKEDFIRNCGYYIGVPICACCGKVVTSELGHEASVLVPAAPVIEFQPIPPIVPQVVPPVAPAVPNL